MHPLQDRRQNLRVGLPPWPRSLPRRQRDFTESRRFRRPPGMTTLRRTWRQSSQRDFERLRAGAPSTPPSPNRGDFAAEDIDSGEATDRLSSALASICTGRVGIGFLLLSLFVAVTVVVLWALPFRSSEQLPSSHNEQGKAVGLPAHDLTKQPSSPAPAPPVSPPPASTSPVTLPGPAEVSSASQIPLLGQPPSPPLNADEIRELQGKLKALGFDPGAIDGVVGPMTTSAVRKYSQARAIADADVTRDLLVRLRAEAPPKE